MLNEKDYCDYELRLGLRDIGYPMSTCQINDGPIQMPKITLYEAQKWLREEKKIDVLIQLDTKDLHLSSKYYSIYMSYMSHFRREFSYISKNFNSYEEALLEGVKKAIKLLKEKQYGKDNNTCK